MGPEARKESDVISHFCAIPQIFHRIASLFHKILGRTKKDFVHSENFSFGSPSQKVKKPCFSALEREMTIFPPAFFSKKSVTKILFKLEVTDLIHTKSRKLGVPRAHPTCAEISVSKIFPLFSGKY